MGTGQPRRELLLDRVQRIFVLLEQHQQPRLEACNLAGEFGADGASGAGDQHHARGEQQVQPCVVEHDLLASEQVFHLDPAHLRYGHLAREQIVVRGHREDRQARLRGQLRGAAPHVRGSLGERHDRMLDLHLRGEALHLGDRAEHAHAEHHLPLAARIVVEDADRPPLGGAGDFLEKIEGDVARAQDQHRLAGELHAAVEAALLPRTVGDAAASHHRHEQQRRKQIGRAGHRHHAAQQHQHGRHGEGAYQAGDQDALQVGKARVAPQPAVQARQPEQDGVQRHAEHDRVPHRRAEVRGDVEVESQPEREPPGKPRGDHVVREREEGTIVEFSAFQETIFQPAARPCPPTRPGSRSLQ